MQDLPQEPAQPPTPKRQNMLATLAIIGVVVVVGGALSATYSWKSKTGSMGGMNHGIVQSHPTYSLNLMEGMTYNAGDSSELMFNIRDENNKVLKNFDTVHEKLLHLIIVRKDRTNFQHVHPNFDKGTGMFAITGFKFPTDGEYRVFADFTARSAQMGSDAMKLPATPYKDVKVGSGAYAAQPLTENKFASSAGGLDTGIFFPPSDDTPGGAPLMDYYAGQDNTIVIETNKNGQSFKNLQPYLGALGHMVVLGPNLEFIHAHPQTADISNQTGLIFFSVNPPVAGRYKLYLQTQTDGQVNTTDYAVSALPKTGGASSNDSMPGMDMEH
jgi:hypothetical protein